MNTNTGELLSAELYEALQKENPKEAELFKSVPDELENEARKELDGRGRTVVDLKKNTPLTNWAHEQNARRHVNKRRVRNKMAKASRKKNRGK